MAKPRTTNGTKVKFPYLLQKNGRTGRIKKWSDDRFGTYFMFAGHKKRNSFGTFEAALTYLEREFSRIDSNQAESLALNPLNGDVRTYSELEQLLRVEGGGATLREAVAFFLANHKGKRLHPTLFEDASAAFLNAQQTRNVSGVQIRTLAKHYRRFALEFGRRKIHEIAALEIETWLGSRVDESDGSPWSVKTRSSVRGSLVSLSLYAQNVLKAIPDNGKTEFQHVLIPRQDQKGEVEIYTPSELRLLLLVAIENDLDLIPALVVGNFAGLRPFEFHAEGLKRSPLQWEAFNWRDKVLHVKGQKVRSKATRDIPLQPVVEAWLAPFQMLKGAIWRYTQAHSKKWITLRKETGVQSIYDGFRHSYASYRIRQLKGDLAQLAAEMGNSPTELIDSYKRNVTDAQAAEWFNILPPAGYTEKVTAALSSRQTA